MTALRRLRWLREHRELMTDGQRKCLGAIVRMLRERVHHASHYDPQIRQLYDKLAQKEG